MAEHIYYLLLFNLFFVELSLPDTHTNMYTLQTSFLKVEISYSSTDAKIEPI